MANSTGRMSLTTFFLLSCTSMAAAFSPSTYTTQSRHVTASTALKVESSSSPPSPFSLVGPSQDLLTLFNDQVTKEFSASQFYLSASIWFDSCDWEGMASYMLAESEEERGHALQFIEFANKRNIPIKLQGLDVPTSTWESPEDVWRDILELERANTSSLLKVAEAANQCQDYAVLAFLNPFHMEQVNAESTISTIIAKVADENKTPGLLRQLDHELGLEAGQEAGIN
mmetsp:Transcript_31079/g.57603  ORF Transcript_31079/g.57603 Transcript_31079/m.57603 type:complete len:228 (-) Transcript_31079:199-882(-)|eukprot:CAMPEP_0196143774 /NCGR_PEP_ID=MMETSP0910-20130528/13706_1 /TAXON_ID=49265 /ORGANISM="Thalassiosira rotula, Strain GSO102" /LENGTH=227 /DNA_ID=CAMNT_0041405261 /DNA_START=161 /DNA_END=844 /DNA_ORIENTATION=+